MERRLAVSTVTRLSSKGMLSQPVILTVKVVKVMTSFNVAAVGAGCPSEVCYTTRSPQKHSDPEQPHELNSPI
jgi:hypothetical protein